MKQVPELLTLSENAKAHLLEAADKAMKKGQKVWGPSCCKEVIIRRPGQDSRPAGGGKEGPPDGGGDPKHPKCPLTKKEMCEKVIKYVDEFAEKNQQRNRAGEVVGGQTAKVPNDTCNKLAEDQSSENFGCFSCCGRAFSLYKFGREERNFKHFCKSKDPCM